MRSVPGQPDYGLITRQSGAIIRRSRELAKTTRTLNNSLLSLLCATRLRIAVTHNLILRSDEYIRDVQHPGCPWQ